jgi:uncharacterized membrane protein
MKLHGFRPNLSKIFLYQLAALAIVIAILLTVFSEVVEQMYFSNQQTSAGLVLNGFILALFLAGMGRIVALFLRYRNEEKSLSAFRLNLDEKRHDALEGVPYASIISSRYETLERMRSMQAEIDHNALAATLMASESTRTGSIRFIYNILILCGVLGTIVSLSMALFGASSLLEDTVSSNGMGMVIHGMSTALSTTMTAILCYLVFGYFYGAVHDVQTNILSAIEHLTTTRLLPDFHVTADAINQKTVDLLKAVSDLVKSINQDARQQDFPRLIEAVHSAVQESQYQHHITIRKIDELQTTLQQGFRLSEPASAPHQGGE